VLAAPFEDNCMSPLDEARTRATATYDAAADAYDDSANTFWERFGRRTVERLDLEPGATVLDVCCGSGASAIPAARAVGPAGSVLGIDLSERLLAIARAKAKAHALSNIAFRRGDMLDVGQVPTTAPARYDAVVCVFGIFFVPDMTAAVSALWKAVRPGGKLAITTWGPRFFEPGNTAFWNAIRDVAPTLYKGFNPWDRICDPPSLQGLLADAGVATSMVVAEDGRHPIPSPEAWWSAVLGSGYRGTFERLDAPARARVRDANLAFIRESEIRSVEANVVYAIAVKPER
jgi:ubiquinone/menaquinone biosynthesis C-methylase UbiE